MSSVSLTCGSGHSGLAQGRLGLVDGASLGVVWRGDGEARKTGVVPLLSGVARGARGRFRTVPARGFGGPESLSDDIVKDRGRKMKYSVRSSIA